jgi:hypothetical protein
MLIHKILLSSGVLACCAVPSVAQSTTGIAQMPAPSVSTVPHDSRTQTPKLDGIAKSAAPTNMIVLQPMTFTIAAPPSRRDRTCYSIRSYNFESVDPASGVTKLKGATACELATNAHLKGVSGILQVNR